MVYNVVGKQSFHSNKNDKDYYVIHCLCQKDGVEGFATVNEFVSVEIFNKIKTLNAYYNFTFDKAFSGRAVISNVSMLDAKK